jgi:hypothetical protein
MAFIGSSARAGGYAHQRYKRGLAAYRYRIRRLLALFFGPFIVVGLVGLLLEGHLASWGAGIAFGLGVGALMALRDSPPAYIENWHIGAEGERKTEKALKTLDRTRWLVVHDVQCARGNYDHIVVGAAGVFLLDTKNLQGVVHMIDGEPHLRRRSDPEADKSCGWIRSSALAGAASLSGEIQRRTGCRLWVNAVVVLWPDFDEGLYEDQKCMLVHGSQLNEWLTSRPDALDATTTQQLMAGIEAIAAEAQPGD